METVQILVRQILQMFLLAGIGYILYRGKKITVDSSRVLANILLYLVMPAVIVNSFLVERTTEHMLGFLYSGIAAVILLLVSMLIARLFFRRDAIASFAAAFSNSGFFGIPLIVASLGQETVFYLVCYLAFLSVCQWTYGVSLLTGQPVRQGLRLNKLIRSPFIIAVLIGMFLFLSQIRIPSVIRNCMNTVTSLNTPLAMFIVGVYLAHVDFRRMFQKKTLYCVSFVRLIITPLVTLLLLSVLPAAFSEMKMVLLLAVACPVGSNIAMYAQLHQKDYSYAVETVIISALFSILTIPAVVWLAGTVW